MNNARLPIGWVLVGITPLAENFAISITETERVRLFALAVLAGIPLLLGILFLVPEVRELPRRRIALGLVLGGWVAPMSAYAAFRLVGQEVGFNIWGFGPTYTSAEGWETLPAAAFVPALAGLVSLASGIRRLR